MLGALLGGHGGAIAPSAIATARVVARGPHPDDGEDGRVGGVVVLLGLLLLFLL